jgi:hypothetical protein
MNAEPQSETATGSLAPECWDVPIRVRLVPYVGFSDWLDNQLEQLVLRWQDKAAPCASRSHR